MQVQAEKIFQVVANEVVPILGTSIICHGLYSSNNLNGRIGDLRSWNENWDCYNVHFEDNDLKSQITHSQARTYLYPY